MSSKVNEFQILNADDTELMRISREGTLSLSLNEMQTIQAHFETLGRNPTDVEIETIAQTWSEHCVHKTFKSTILYSEQGKAPEQIDGLFPTFIQRATEEIAKPWCVSVFSDNAGIIEFDEQFNLVFKVETHNHPSAIEPYGGAGTGIRRCHSRFVGYRPRGKTDSEYGCLLFRDAGYTLHATPERHTSPQACI